MMYGQFAGYCADGPTKGTYLVRDRPSFEVALEPPAPRFSLDPRPIPMDSAVTTVTYWFTVDGEWRVRG